VTLHFWIWKKRSWFSVAEPTKLAEKKSRGGSTEGVIYGRGKKTGGQSNEKRAGTSL